MTDNLPPLQALRLEMEYIAGQWDGDLPGLKEDRAEVANDIIKHVDKIIELLDELNEL